MVILGKRRELKEKRKGKSNEKEKMKIINVNRYKRDIL